MWLITTARQKAAPRAGSDRAMQRVLLLSVCFTLVRTWGLFLLDDVLSYENQRSSVTVASWVLAASAVVFAALHRPWRRQAVIPKDTHKRIAVNGATLAVSTVLWVVGLRHCRALRVTLLENADLPILLFVLMTTPVWIARRRGVLLSAVGAALLIPSIWVTPSMRSPLTASGGQITKHPSLFHAVFGVVAIATASVLSFTRQKKSQALAAEVGGMRLLNLLSITVAAVCVCVVDQLMAMVAFGGDATTIRAAHHRGPTASWWLLVHVPLCALSTVVLQLYTEPHMVGARGAHVGSVKEARLGGALALGMFLSYIRGDGQVEPWVCASASLLYLGLRQRNTRRAHAHTHAHAHTETSAQAPLTRLAQSPIVQVIARFMGRAMSSRESRRMLAFLCLSTAFMLVEMVVGWASNSLGLMADAGHMLFDNLALLIGLWAATASKSNRRAEVVAGLINSLFLVFFAITLLLEAVERIIHGPPPIEHTHLTCTAVCGFLINLLGFVLVHDLALDKGQHTDHGHTHSGCAHAHHTHGDTWVCYLTHTGRQVVSQREGKKGCGARLLHLIAPTADVNLQGVLVHLAADTLGSLSVLVSTLLVRHMGVYIADPLCSVCVAVCVLCVVAPLLTHAVRVLTHTLPPPLQTLVDTLVCGVRDVHGVEGVESVQAYEGLDCIHLTLSVAITALLHTTTDTQAHTHTHHAHAMRECVEGVVYTYLDAHHTRLTLQLHTHAHACVEAGEIDPEP